MKSLTWLCSTLVLGVSLCAAQSTPANGGVLDLSVENAIAMATAANGNYSFQLSAEAIRMANSRHALARSALLPRLDGAVTEQNQLINLRALGVQFPPSPAFTVPHEVGPYSTFDARVSLNQTVFDLGAVQRSKAAAADARAARADSDSVRQQVAATTARLYAVALRAQAELATAQANLSLAESLRDVSQHRESAGEAITLETTRAEVGVSRNQQSLLAAQTSLTTASLDLISALHLDWNTNLHLTGQLGVIPPAVTPEEAVATALKSRAALAAEQQRLESARLSYSAAGMDRLPSVIGYGDYGSLSSVTTHTVGVSVRVPLFEYRINAERAQAISLMRQEEIRQKELRTAIELEVRKAIAVLASARNQLQVADRAVSLGEDELGRARRRYQAGLANNLELVNAQERLENAHKDQVAARFQVTQASIDLAQAMGTVQSIHF